jgi:hypothetical protein
LPTTNIQSKKIYHATYCSAQVFAWLISHPPAVLFSQNKPATSNQPAVLFSQNKSAPAISHQPTEQACNKFDIIRLNKSRSIFRDFFLNFQFLEFKFKKI